MTQLNEPLSQLSLLFVSASMGFLAVALMFFSFQLATLSKQESAPTEMSKLESIAFWVTGVATTILGVGVAMRGIAAARVPWANMYEFAISAAFLILLVYLTSLKIKDLRFVATFVVAFALVTLFAAVAIFYVEVKTIMPALQSYWLVIHVVVAVLATSFFTIAASLHLSYLIKAGNIGQKVMRFFPTLEKLERYAYRFNGDGSLFVRGQDFVSTRTGQHYRWEGFSIGKSESDPYWPYSQATVPKSSVRGALILNWAAVEGGQ